MSKRHQIICKDDQPELVVVPWDEYVRVFQLTEDDLDEIAFQRAIATDDGVRIPGEIVNRLVDGQHPVQAYREYHNMTLEALGAQVGMTATYIDAVERGSRPLSKSKLMRRTWCLGRKSDPSFRLR